MLVRVEIVSKIWKSPIIETLNAATAKFCLSTEIRAQKEQPTMEDSGDELGIHCFTEVVDELTLHFQIIRLPKQIYAWIGCNSSKLGHLYAAANTRPSQSGSVSVSCVLGGASDNTGSGIARRIVLKSGLNVMLACNIPKNSPMIEASAERKMMEKLVQLGYTQPKLEQSVSS